MNNWGPERSNQLIACSHMAGLWQMPSSSSCLSTLGVGLSCGFVAVQNYQEPAYRNTDFKYRYKANQTAEKMSYENV